MARLRGWIKDPVFALITFLLVTLDISFVDKRYFTGEKFKSTRLTKTIAPTEADNEILRDKSYYRVFQLPPSAAWNDAKTSYFHHSIGGYHGAKMRRYQDLFDSCLFRQTQGLIEAVNSGSADFTPFGSINMLNVKYMVYGPAKNNILPNPYANGPAWFVNSVEKVNSPAEELAKVCQINTLTTAVVDVSKFPVSDLATDSTSQINLIEHKPNYLKYESETSAGGLAVFSEIFYPKGWVATIDGKETPILRANYVLRALIIPSGKHTIEFRFDPAPYQIGNNVTAAASWLVLLLLFASVFMEYRKSQ
jgi:hypothetical protein